MRCPPRVVNIANHLIARDSLYDTPAPLRAAPNKPNGEIHIVQWSDQNEEAKGIAEYIQHLLANGKYKPDEILIISTRRKLASEIQNMIEEKGIPIHTSYQPDVLKTASAQRAFALLALLNNKDDLVALRWWLGYGDPQHRADSYRNLREYCEHNNKSPRDTLEDAVHGRLDLPGTSPLLQPFKDMIKETDRLSSLSLPDLVDDLLPRDADDCSLLRSIAEHALANSKDINQLFRTVAADAIQIREPSGNHVRIMSPHKAKGLSSKVVIATGCNEGFIPYIDKDRPPSASNVSEQCRLLYVAITRCKETLVLSSFAAMDKASAYAMNIPFTNGVRPMVRVAASRFIGELRPLAPDPVDGENWRASGYK